MLKLDSDEILVPDRQYFSLSLEIFDLNEHEMFEILYRNVLVVLCSFPE